jgi:putative ABC transport system substrate-binding protein
MGFNPMSSKKNGFKGVRGLSESLSNGEKKGRMLKGLSCLLILSLLVSVSNSIAKEERPKRMIKIGIAQTVSRPDLDADSKGFEKALAEAGFKEGVQITYIRKNAQGKMANAQAIAQNLIDEKVDLIHSIAIFTSQTVVKKIREVPIVFSSVSDPADAGLISKATLPQTKTGTNVTGVSDRWPVFLQLEMSTKFTPRAKKWGTIYHRKDANSLAHIQELRESAQRLGVELVEAKISIRGEIMQAVQSLSGKVQAIYLTHDHTVSSALGVIVKVCNEKKIPLFTGDIYSVPRGAIAAYGLDYFFVGHSAGEKAVRILRGEKAGDIPWETAEKFSLIINEKAAKAQGFFIPPELLKKADKVIGE